MLCFFTVGLLAQNNSGTKENSRESWLNSLDKVCRPVLFNLAGDVLKQKMLVALSPSIDNAAERKEVAYLEAFGRTMSGIAPWLQLEEGSAKEIALRQQYRQCCLKAVANAVDPSAKDYMVWNKGGQPLVDASFLALAFVRCPWLWSHLDSNIQQHVVTAFTSTRKINPPNTNWLLFSAMIEAFFCKYGLPYEEQKIEHGIHQFMQNWYVGDGLFSDGAEFHMDYYNSYVIQPYITNIIDAVRTTNSNAYDWATERLDKITKRYAEIQERNINSDGSFPVIGRSITYRGGAFHQLADMALRKQLPASLSPAQVRCGLESVIKKTLSNTSFNDDGWLKIGMVNDQPNLADRYITTGSLYLCTEIFLPLGLPESDAFWSGNDMPWTALKIWNGQDAAADHAMDLQ